jgi:hypothetical protein
MISYATRAGEFEVNKNRALKLALDALEQIAFAEMLPSIEMSDKAIEKWHARKAWKFIEIAKSKLKPIKEALAQPAQKPDELTIAYMSGLYDGKKAEREACALIVEDMNSLMSPEIAKVIRARGSI